MSVGDQPRLIPGLEIPAIEKRMAAHSSIFAWEIHGQKSLVGYIDHGVTNTLLSDQHFHIHT